MFFLNSRGRNCSILPTKNLPLGSEFLKSMVQTEVSFNKIGRRIFGEKTRRSLLKFGNNLSKNGFYANSDTSY